MRQDRLISTLTEVLADTTEHTIWDSSADGSGAGYIQRVGLERLTLILRNSAAGTLSVYHVHKSGTETKIVDYAVTADTGPWTTGIPDDHDFDLYVGNLDDVRLAWTNSAATEQTTWETTLKGHYERSVTT